MDFVAASLILIAGILFGGAAVWLVRGQEIRRLIGDIQRAEAELTEAARNADSLAREANEAKLAHAKLAGEHAAEDRAHEKELAALTALRGDIETKLQALTGEALRGSQESFLTLAAQVFDKQRQATDTILGEKQKAIEALLAPISASLEAYRTGLADIERARVGAYGNLTAYLQEVGRETRKLTTALQAAPKTRGRWGEQQLHNVMELSGMTPYVDFEAERTFAGDEGRLRPDVVIRLPGDRRIVVDAKTSMAAYLDAIEAEDDEARQTHLDGHARQIRTHMKQLAAKAYWEALPFTPDFVVMFIPGENFFAAAIERDPQLFEDAIAERVLIVTPTTLIALAKAIAFGWKQETIAEDARKVAKLGRDLYRRLATMGGHVLSLGKGLDGAVKHFNAMVGSLEGSVMPQARKFNELKIDGTADALPELKPIEGMARELRSGGDLVLSAEVIPLAIGAGDRVQASD